MPSDSQRNGKEKNKKKDTVEYMPEGLVRVMSNAQAFIDTLEGAGSVSQVVASKLRNKIEQTITGLELLIKSESTQQGGQEK